MTSSTLRVTRHSQKIKLSINSGGVAYKINDDQYIIMVVEGTQSVNFNNGFVKEDSEKGKKFVQMLMGCLV